MAQDSQRADARAEIRRAQNARERFLITRNAEDWRQWQAARAEAARLLARSQVKPVDSTRIRLANMQACRI